MLTDSEITDLLETAAPGMEQADCAIVFGNALAQPALVAANLFHQGLAGYLVVTGGPRRDDPTHVEADRHLEILLESGVPRERIIVERRSQNTIENATFASELVHRMFSPRTLIAVTLWYHRRALLAIPDAFPQVERIFTATYEPVKRGETISRAGWAKAAYAPIVRAAGERLAGWSEKALSKLIRTENGWLVCRDDGDP